MILHRGMRGYGEDINWGQLIGSTIGGAAQLIGGLVQSGNQNATQIAIAQMGADAARQAAEIKAAQQGPVLETVKQIALIAGGVGALGVVGLMFGRILGGK